MARRSYHGSRRRSTTQDETDAWGWLGLFVIVGLIIRFLAQMPAWRLIAPGISLAALIAAIAYVVRMCRQRRERERLMGENVDGLTPTDFELCVVMLLRDLGWMNVKHSGGSGDRGVDIRGEHNGARCIVQCKRYTKKHVTPAQVRELVGTLHNQQADRAYLITSSRFTQQGDLEARGKPIELWDRAMLVQKMREVEEARRDPAVVRRELRRRRLFLGALVFISGITVLWSTFVPLG